MNASADDVLQLLALAKSGETKAIGRLLEFYRGYLSILAQLQFDERIQQLLQPLQEG